MSYNNGPKSVTSGLVLVLDAGNSKSYPGSGASWTDISGNSNTATLVGTPTYTTDGGGGIVFNGSTQYATISNSSTLNMGNGSFTGEVWIKITNYNAGERMIFEYNVWGNSGTYQLTTFGNQIRVNFPEAYAASKYLDYNYNPLTTNIWMQIVGQFDTSNNNYNLFLNGTFLSQVTGVTQEIGNVTSTMYIASRGAGSLLLPCTFGLFRMYNRALSSDEVFQNYAATRTRFGL